MNYTLSSRLPSNAGLLQIIACLAIDLVVTTKNTSLYYDSSSKWIDIQN
jgi:hypothetical protein